MKEHPHAEILRAIADGKKVQMRHSILNTEWNDEPSPLEYLDGKADSSFEFRIKPETITINGREVPEPVREPLTDGQKYFLVSFGFEGARQLYWNGGSIDRHYLNHGLIHHTREAAIAHVEALLSFTRSDK